MKIGIVVDSNVLRKQADLLSSKDPLDNITFMSEYIEDYKKSNIKDKHHLKIFLPEIVIEELIEQKRDAFEKEYNKIIESLKNIGYGIDYSVPINKNDATLDDIKVKYSTDYSILHVDKSEKTFEKLISCALTKKPPFDKSVSGQKTDAGFKDALIWESILSSDEIDEMDELYFFTGDKVFTEESNKKYLEKEFNGKHPKTILKINEVTPDASKVQNSLLTIINDHKLKQTDIIKLYNENLILDSIKSLPEDMSKYIFLLIKGLKKIYFKDFDVDDFQITDVIKEDDIFNVEICFKTNKYELDGGEQQYALKGKLKAKYKKVNRTMKNTEISLIYSSVMFDWFHNINRVLENYQSVSDSLKKQFSTYGEDNYGAIYTLLSNKPDELIKANDLYYINKKED